MDEGLNLLLEDVGIVAVETLVWLHLDHLLFVVRSDDSSVEGYNEKDEGQARPHEEGMQVLSGLSVEAILQKLAESQFLDVIDRQQMIVIQWIVEDI